MPETETVDLAKLTKELGAAYKKWKSGETAKNNKKSAFWDAIDALALAEPEEKLVDIEVQALYDEITVETYIEQQYPAWNLDAYQDKDDETIEAILTLKPEFSAFEYVNHDDGMVYARQFVNGSPVLDDDQLQLDSPELWNEITDIPHADDIKELLFEAGVDHEEINQWLDDRWKGVRILKPLDSLDPDTLAVVQHYVHPGPPQTKLPAPRKAKPEELEMVVVDEDEPVHPDDDGSGYPDGLE